MTFNRAKGAVRLWVQASGLIILTLLFSILGSRIAMANTVNLPASTQDIFSGASYDGFTFSVNAPGGGPMCLNGSLFSIAPALGFNIDTSGSYVPGNVDFRIRKTDSTKFQISSMQAEDFFIMGSNYTITGYADGTQRYSDTINFETPKSGTSAGSITYDCSGGISGTLTFNNWTGIDEIRITGPDISLGIGNINYIPGQTAAPTISTPITAGSKAVSGTAVANAAITLSKNGSLLGTATADAGGNWSYSSAASFSAGNTISVTAQGVGDDVSAPATATVVATVPGAPTGVSATAGNSWATVNFTAPVSDGGSPIASYTVTSNPGGLTATGSASPITISGLVNGTSYSFTVTAANGVGTSGASASSNSVTPSHTNAAPVVTVSGGTTSFTEGSSAVAVDPGLTVNDSDNTTLASATVSLGAGFQVGEDILSFINTDPATFGDISAFSNASTGVLTLTSAGAKATLNQWQAALRSVTYNNSSESPDISMRTVSFVVNDGTDNSIVVTKDLSVMAVNDSPSVTAPGSITVYENQATPLTGISFSDTDAGSGSVTVDFTATSSTFSAISGGGVIASGTGTSSLELTGTISNINAYITANNVSVTMNINSGPGSLTITINDNGNTGSGGALSGSSSIMLVPKPRISSLSPMSGSAAGGTSVSITGSGFSGATDVKFGSTSVTGYTVINDSLITVTSPAGSGLVDVTVTGPGGTSAPSPNDQFTYLVPNQDQGAPTGLTGITPTTAANNDGKITGVSDSMEYRLQGAATFTPVTALATEITDLAAGTYQVRYAARTGFNAGTAADVVVPAYIPPITPPISSSSSFLSLGDSIACGMSAATGSDYSHLFYNHLLADSAFSQLTLNNLAVSGDKSSDLLQRLQTPQYITAVGNAKVITISIGGDNLLSPVIASVCTAFGVNPASPNLTADLAAAMAVNPNKNAILTSLANSPALRQALQSGVGQFGTDFPQIIAAIKTLSPQAQIYVLNLYNPFGEQDPLYPVFDPLIRGINQVLSNNAGLGYRVADVYTKFRNTSGAVAFNLGAIQLDPHPTTAGHGAIYQALLNAESGQLPLSYYTVNIAPLTGGSITAISSSATSGSAISLAITPDNGMQLKPGTLVYNDGITNHSINGTSFTMPAANVVVKAEFEATATTSGAIYYSVDIGSLTGGNITASPTLATSGSAISLTITPDNGMQLKPGTLVYNNGITNYVISGTGFTMPAANVVITAEFEIISPAQGVSSDNRGGSYSSSSPVSTSTSTSTTISGKVIDSTSGDTLANAAVTVMTDSNGKTTISMKAAQTVMYKQSNGTTDSLSDLSKIAVTGNNGMTAAISADGTIQVSDLAKGTDNNFAITYDLGNGQKITIGTLDINVDSNGNVTVTTTLIDPYGIITDAATGKALESVHVTLYYADTERNKASGKTPDAVVALPGISGFGPNDNKNPQDSDKSGAYGFMVFPNSDYYIVATKDGYESYKSMTIAVEQEIVKWDFKMSRPLTGVTRLSGNSCVDTALAIAKASYTGKVNSVILTTAENYPDALAGSVLAYKLNAPILLVGSTDADQEKVLDYMKNDLDSSGTVYILGGTAAVSSAVESKVTACGFTKITRLGGTDRYETSAKIADQLAVKTGTPIVLAYGENYPDALSISSIAAQMQAPILLVSNDGISDSIRQEIQSIKPSKVYIIGGEGVISSTVESQIQQLSGLSQANIVRIWGADRYATSLAAAKYFNLASPTICIATGGNFPDALAGSSYAANHNASILLVDDSMSDQLENYLLNKKLTSAAIFGGEAVISKMIEQKINGLIEK
ncbi:cell wall-binding protein [Desulfosporosinus acidiphilus SJ4]|uniref:Cell wall-binding protein n=1 Tax=Desulfosporosinus acidiphilus (strain DSM 22704 / JCM 16185 / SJ4) TaxID=646529 RepID=I4DC15_DESAJ|nr:cell wall-binding repeat-containing protein [Desulfosporosinus acidiphilus]AFM43339.1 cell wall-binding protein [Desulfosporosinus acidiphilus SJ4]